jgi:hypothetical protein
MAYRDPYTNQNQYGGQQAYNPYEDLRPHAPYEHAPYEPAGAYTDEPFTPPKTTAAPYSATRTPGFEKAGGFVGPPVRQSVAWDNDIHENLWTRVRRTWPSWSMTRRLNARRAAA